MTEQLQVDVVVVGAGSSGSYFAWRLAQAGFRTMVLEQRRLDQVGQEIDIFHMDEVRFDQFGLPHPGGEELIGYYPTGLAWSPDLQVQNEVRYAFYVMHKPAFNQRLHGYVQESGGEIMALTKVLEPIVEGGAVTGVRAEKDGKLAEVRGRIVVDASGIGGAVRTMLPASLGVENDPIRSHECLFVCLEFRDDLGEGMPTGLNFYPYHKAFWNPSRDAGAILGIGQPDSYENAWQKHREWREEYFGDPGKVVKRTQGRTPYRRSPYSLVANGFMVIGDAAFQTKPFSGEGVTSSFTACQIAAKVAAAALQAGDTRREVLWPYNVRYFRDQGARFASMFIQLPAAAELSRPEVDFLFHQDLIFSSQDFEQMNLHYATEMDLGKTLGMAAKLAGGVLGRQFSWDSLRRLLEVSGRAGRVRDLYERFPEQVTGFESWVTEVQPLWRAG